MIDNKYNIGNEVYYYVFFENKIYKDKIESIVYDSDGLKYSLFHFDSYNLYENEIYKNIDDLKVHLKDELTKKYDAEIKNIDKIEVVK